MCGSTRPASQYNHRISILDSNVVFAPFIVSIFIVLAIALACWRCTRKTSVLSLALGTFILLALWLAAGDGIGEFKTMVGAMLAFYGTTVACLILIASAIWEYTQFQRLNKLQLVEENLVKIAVDSRPGTPR